MYVDKDVSFFGMFCDGILAVDVGDDGIGFVKIVLCGFHHMILSVCDVEKNVWAQGLGKFNREVGDII